MREREIDSWLGEQLSDGECHLCESVRDAAKRAGINQQDLRASRKRLGVKTFHQFDESGDTGNWFWFLGGGE